MRWKKIKKIGSIIVLIYFAGGLAMYFLQDLFIFHPEPLPKDYTFRFDQPFTEVDIIRPDNRNLNLIEFHTTQAKGIVLYFHGNKRNVERYAPYAPRFTKNGYEVWMVDYPGYGKSTGKRTEQTMYEDALLLYKRALQTTTADKIIIYGKSLGTGVASFLASQRLCKTLILETPYYSMQAVAQHYFPIYPTKQLINYVFPNNECLKEVRIPVIAFHGTSDEVIPFKQAQRLKRENHKLELIVVPEGKHNNLYEFPLVTAKLDSILQ